jgi:hypothetical protein
MGGGIFESRAPAQPDTNVLSEMQTCPTYRILEPLVPRLLGGEWPL